MSAGLLLQVQRRLICLLVRLPLMDVKGGPENFIIAPYCQLSVFHIPEHYVTHTSLQKAPHGLR